MVDILEKKKIKINVDKLEKMLGTKVCEISALKNTGIDDLISYNENIINIISDYTRCILINNKDIDVSMMYEGTRKIKSNFNTFALTNDGLLIFFERYQVAPYYKGEFKVLIPYKYVK